MATLQNFGVPTGNGAGRGNMLHPKVKYKFRVRVFGFGPVAGGIEFTRQVMSADRPTLNYPSQAVHSYNSTGYYAGKHEWSPISITLREDVTNTIGKLVQHQIQKQVNHVQQTSPLAGANYKFQMIIETMDGSDGVIETWLLEGCFLETSNMDSFDYSSSDAMTIQLSIRYDNATSDLMTENPENTPGVLLA